MTAALMLIAGSSGCSGGSGGAFQSAWSTGLNRTWIGPEYHANRLADWRIRDGRLECIEARPRFPVRTLHLLTRSLHAGPGSFTIRVLTGPVDSEAIPSPDSWTGFLIGGGGNHVDYRLSAWIHHRPAEDGGLMAIVDGAGRVGFRDNSNGSTPSGQWAIGGQITDEVVPLIGPARSEGVGMIGGLRSPVLLELAGEPEADGYSLRLIARDPETGESFSEATIVDVPPSQVDGCIALVSHLGPAGSDSGFWFRDWRIAGARVSAHETRTFGPVLTTQYTLSRGILKLTAQMGPLGPDDTRSAELQIRPAGERSWRTVATADWIDDSYTIPFRVTGWDASADVPYRVLYDLRIDPDTTRRYSSEGTIRAEPRDEREFVVAAFTGHKNYTGGLRWNHNGYWFPHLEIIAAIDHHDPDFLFFSGDQVYEGDLTPSIAAPIEEAILDYLYKWNRWCWGFSAITRDRPTVTIPDDHDVYHGNIWGAGGKKAEAGPGMTAQDSGGYKMSPRFVNVVHRTQTSHLPDPFDPTPVEQGITAYYTDINYGGMSFAVLADRQWKSSPMVAVPEGRFVNGWPQNPEFDPATQADVPGAILLGRRQLDFLGDWAADWSDGVWMKAVLSQTIFSNVATLPQAANSGAVLPGLPVLMPGEYPANYKKAYDGDSNGWPQSGRNRALREIRRAFALHIAGDQHLGSTIQYGIDEWHDAGYALCVPSIGNTWPRRWFPPEAGANRKPGAPEYTGDFLDGFGNRMTVHAVSNPFQTGIEPANLYDRAPGYGIVRFRRETRDIIIECWPRWVDPAEEDANQYPGWPVVLNQSDNYGRTARAWLPDLQIIGMTDPVVQVIDESGGEVVYTLRINGSAYRPGVFAPGSYTIRIGEPGTERMRVVTGVRSLAEPGAASLEIDLSSG